MKQTCFVSTVTNYGQGSKANLNFRKTRKRVRDINKEKRGEDE